MSQTTSDAEELNLLKLLLGFMKFASDKGEKSFPPYESELWHYFLYLLKSDFEKKFPELECIGHFEWDGADPKCWELKTVMFEMRYQCDSKSFGGRTFLSERSLDGNEFTVPSLEIYHPKLAETALVLAQQIPEFFEPRA